MIGQKEGSQLYVFQCDHPRCNLEVTHNQRDTVPNGWRVVNLKVANVSRAGVFCGDSHAMNGFLKMLQQKPR